MFENFEIFNNENLGSVRTITDPETKEIWFLANDVANALGYQASRNAIAVHTAPDDRKTLKYKACTESVRAKLWGPNDFMDKIFINESGLYCLIFGSEMEKAIDFKTWITKTVIPSIRQNGGYILGQENLSEKEQEKIKAQVKDLKKTVARLQKRRHELIADYKKAETTRKKQKKEIKALNSYAANFERMYFNLEDEYEKVMLSLKAAKQQAINQFKLAPENEPRPTIKVDKYGFVTL